VSTFFPISTRQKDLHSRRTQTMAVPNKALPRRSVLSTSAAVLSAPRVDCMSHAYLRQYLREEGGSYCRIGEDGKKVRFLKKTGEVLA